VSGNQLELFGRGTEMRSDEADLVALARRLPPNVAFGTSSWTFPGWTGIVYQKPYRNQRELARDSLEEYARYPLFNTVGIDSTYYRPARAETLRHYHQQLPRGFRCLMKVSSEITTFAFPDHERAGARRNQENPSFLDAASFQEQVHAAVAASGFTEHLAAYVLELPPSHGRLAPARFVSRLERFLADAPAARYAVELRDPQLMTDAYLRLLDAAGASHVFNFHSRMPTLSQQLRRVSDTLGHLPSELVVARLLQPPGTNYEALKKRYAPFDRLVAPNPTLRADVLDLISAASAQGAATFVIVNNKAEGSAPLTIRALAESLRDVTAPDPLGLSLEP
jgi:uncharacterized protein YecE (DUF72 family)